MTLNQARDKIFAVAPNRTLFVSAQSAHQSHYGDGERQKFQTDFNITIFRENGGNLQKAWHGHHLSELVESVLKWLAAGGTDTADETAEATSEPEAATTTQQA